MGKDCLDFSASEVGTHSNHSSAAMAMYLANVPVYTTMQVRCWSSVAFLAYICKQVQDFTKSVSTNMFLSPDYFKIPTATCSYEEPHMRNTAMNFASRPQNIQKLNQHIDAP
eukprot:4537861-Ditylum_brightwellii.AAC.1